jgi:uncharacterized protein YdcH (DUF465 family)
MTNPYEHHDLAAEFPEYKERIHALKGTDAHFQKLATEYEDVCKEVARIEQDIETPGDHYTEDRKKRRIQLKDALFALLQDAA